MLGQGFTVLQLCGTQVFQGSERGPLSLCFPRRWLGGSCGGCAHRAWGSILSGLSVVCESCLTRTVVLVCTEAMLVFVGLCMGQIISHEGGVPPCVCCMTTVILAPD